jgi:3-hydroxyisobutyrate dehydrogenase-like beta-hydroxyacid dehydrogenase
MKPIGILGLGEVGEALSDIYKGHGTEIATLDLRPDLCKGDLAAAETIHVCVPRAALEECMVQRGTEPLYIVHTTTGIGDCRALSTKGFRLVHAPVRGIHPKLAQSLQTFAMPVSGPKPLVKEAIDRLRSIGIPAERWGEWESTEIAKLLCTTRYGIDILFMRAAADLCAKYGVDFDQVYRDWTMQYNDGYLSLGDWQFVRPVLRPMPGPIGGHCVVPNADTLSSHSEWAQKVSKEGREEWEWPKSQR